MKNLKLKPREDENLFTLIEASKWASSYLEREISESNISYLIQYGKIRKNTDNGATLVLKNDLIEY